MIAAGRRPGYGAEPRDQPGHSVEIDRELEGRGRRVAREINFPSLRGVKREADSGSPAGVTENMTPDQVRALLGAPDEVTSETTDSGVTRERWIYRSAGKTVVFENGVATSVQYSGKRSSG